jgi:hypothetical protein
LELFIYIKSANCDTKNGFYILKELGKIKGRIFGDLGKLYEIYIPMANK